MLALHNNSQGLERGLFIPHGWHSQSKKSFTGEGSNYIPTKCKLLYTGKSSKIHSATYKKIECQH